MFCEARGGCCFAQDDGVGNAGVATKHEQSSVCHRGAKIILYFMRLEIYLQEESERHARRAACG